jgi:hypothetical protein
MINPTTDCFYVIQAEGEAASLVSEKLSASTVQDIREVILISEDFDNDIQASESLDNAIEEVKSRLGEADLTEATTFNPLYIPSSQEAIDDVLDGDVKSESYRFVGMDGSPFTWKTVSISGSNDEELLMGKISYKPFDLPGYSEILAAHANVKIN